MLILIIVLFVSIAIGTSIVVRSLNNPVAITLVPIAFAATILQFDPFGTGFVRGLTFPSFLCLLMYAFIMVIPYTAFALRIEQLPAVGFNLHRSGVVPDRLWRICILLLLLGLFGFFFKLVHLTRSLGLPLSPHGIFTLYTIKFAFVEKNIVHGFSTLHNVGMLGLFYAAVMLSTKDYCNTRKRLILGSLVVIYLVSKLAIIVKVGFIMTLLLFLFAWITTTGRVPKLFLLVCVIVGSIVPIVDKFIYTSNIKIALDNFAVYLAGPLIALGYYLSSHPVGHVFAAESLKPFYQVLDKLGLYNMDEYSKFNVLVPVTDSGVTCNPATFLRTPYLDFGLGGMVVYLIGWSLLTFILFIMVRRYNSLFLILLYTTVATSLCLAFIANKAIDVNLIMLILLHFLLRPYITFNRLKWLRRR